MFNQQTSTEQYDKTTLSKDLSFFFLRENKTALKLFPWTLVEISVRKEWKHRVKQVGKKWKVNNLTPFSFQRMEQRTEHKTKSEKKNIQRRFFSKHNFYEQKKKHWKLSEKSMRWECIVWNEWNKIVSQLSHTSTNSIWTIASGAEERTKFQISQVSNTFSNTLWDRVELIRRQRTFLYGPRSSGINVNGIKKILKEKLLMYAY